MRDEGALHDASFRLDRASIEAVRHPVGPVTVGDHQVTLRRGRWSDGPSWCRVRRQDEQHLRPAFGSADRSWESSTSMTAWVEHLIDLRRRARKGLAVPLLAVGGDSDVIGEVNFYVDSATGSAEISVWMKQGMAHEVSEWVTATCLRRVLTLPAGLGRVTAPIAVDNPGPRRLFERCGFVPAAVARELRSFDGEVVDHDIWWLDPTPGHLDRLDRVIADATSA